MSACAAGRCGREAATEHGFCCDWCEVSWTKNWQPAVMHSERCNRLCLDAAAGARLRDDAIDRVEQNADVSWSQRALAAVRRVCERDDQWIVDAVWAELGFHDKPREARAMGAVLRQAVRLRWCERTEQYEPSAQPQCHRNPRTVWRSLR